MKTRKLVSLPLLAVALAAGSAGAASSRYDWVVSRIYNYNHPFASQLPNELQTKMQKMSAGAFAFYRGTAHLFFEDMTTLPPSSYGSYATSQTWLNGDMHMLNIGAFRDANGNTVYDTTDFDESYWGQYVWDLRRMAVSIILGAKENGIGSSNRQQLVLDFLDTYLNKIDDFHGTDDELSYRLTSSNTSGTVKDTIQKSASQSRSDLLAKYTTVTGGNRVFQTTSELQTVSAASYSAIQSAVASYVNTIPSSKRYSASYYAVKDIRIKLGSGVGSLGRYRYYVLIQGPGNSNGDDVILQLKQESPSVVATATPGNMPAYVYEYHEGERAAKSMKANLTNTDVLAGWTTINGQPYFVREKSPYEADLDSTKLNGYGSFSAAVQYMAKIVAKNHALADQDYDPNLISYSIDKQIDNVVSGYKSAFKNEVLCFAIDYAAQVELDYQSFLTAYNNGVPLY
jgi:uncharacterized protein (DUF2252 family)